MYSGESKLIHDKCGVKFEELHVFQLQMLSNATGNFDSSNKLGQGGFGLVYKVFHFSFKFYFELSYSVMRYVIP